VLRSSRSLSLLRKQESIILETAGFLLEFIPMKIGAGMTFIDSKSVFYEFANIFLP
jgi:hypothetical protein